MDALVLIVEDELLLARNVKTFLERKGCTVDHAATLADARAAVERVQPDIVLVDHNLPDGFGLDFIREIRAKDRWTKLVMMTAFGGVDVAVAAMKGGADDYLTKPVPLDEIAIIVDRLVRQSRVENALQFRQDREHVGLARIIGQSAPMRTLKQRIRMLTAAELQADPTGQRPGPPVLILGETGTGKELIARALHSEGPRAQRPFVELNCAALPEQLIESELFGHEKGAFTGATDKKIGLFQAADGGTLFLDEIGELPLAQQAKLLKAIEEKAIRPVGSVRERPVNIRLVAATNAGLTEKAARGEFRSDLLYRLNTIVLDVPPLRARDEDILLLADRFTGEFRQLYKRHTLTLADSARRALTRHDWPGNIRELRNVIENACLMATGSQIEATDLALGAPRRPVADSAETKPGGLVEAERQMIVDALRQHAGNVTNAARMLGVSRDTLRYRMEKFALSRTEFG